MLSQKCFDCALKHVATALSYAKEILGGHTEGNPLDHRIDLLGELCNLEHHLELLDRNLLNEAQMLRRILQSRCMAVNEADIQKLRDFYVAIEKKSEIPSKTLIEASRSVARSREGYKVVIDSPSDSERFQVALQGLMENVLNPIEVFVLNPSIDVQGATVVNQPLKDFVEQLDDDVFVYMTENEYIINRCDFNLLPDIFLQEKCKGHEQYKECRVYPFEWDCGAPHILEKEKFLKTYHEDEDVLTCYYVRNGIKPVYNAYSYVVRVEHKLCCASRGQAESGYIYATALDNDGFLSLKEWLLTRRQK